MRYMNDLLDRRIEKKYGLKYCPERHWFFYGKCRRCGGEKLPVTVKGSDCVKCIQGFEAPI